ncbi:glutamate-5-semialdehyde dehydrogenase [Pelagibacteraceae bacterium]|jgi:glutamate-5-semialdehyde dehydrogenase|nr:glutamate-5-semialdehyde dehydrogenase [Pelagibacteraceae bacterium]
MIKNLNMEKIGINARIASNDLGNLSIKKRNAVLKQFCIYLKNNSNLILNANKNDLNNAKKLKSTMIERLKLDSKKINQIIKSVSEIIKFKDPLNKTLSSWSRPNGLIIKRISTSIGVIGVIYESRPNVTSDVSALCFKAGSAVILRGGSEAFYSNKILSDLFRKALKKKGCNINCVQFIKNKDRSNVDYLLSDMKKYIDIIIPRGGKSLVKKITSKSKIPTIGHLEGLCHVYIDKKSDLKMAIKVVENAKMRNTSICGAAETLLIDKACLKTHCEPVLSALSKLGCQVIGDKKIEKNFSKKIKIAKEKDWSTEYLSPKISVKSVDGVDGAIHHINKYGTSHTDSIVTKDKKAAEKFFLKINSSIIVHNASTQFADGGEFGFGAEVGISTNKVHPRGPVGLDQLVSYKYILKGKGQIRK